MADPDLWMARCQQVELDGPTLCYLSTGTTGQPKVVRFTPEDWQEVVQHRARLLERVGVRRGDGALVLLPHGPWFTGDNVTDALLSLGATVLQAGTYRPHLPGALQAASRLDIDVVITTPTLALSGLTSVSGVTPRLLVLLGEHAGPELRGVLRERLGCVCRSIYAASEALIGAEREALPDAHYVWDPERLFLEVKRPDGTISHRGSGTLLVTRRYGVATPLVRFPLGDRVDLLEDEEGRSLVRFRGREGHAFGLSNGVTCSRARLDAWLDSLALPVGEVRVDLRHERDGRDRLEVELRTKGGAGDPERAWERLLSSSLDIADLQAGGHLQARCTIRPHQGVFPAKRRVTIREAPWLL